MPGGQVVPGKMFVFQDGGKTIINFPTKRHWKGPSELEYIESGSVSLVLMVQSLGIESIAVPPLGCGLGGLDWNMVRPKIEQAFADLAGVCVLLYEPL